MTTSSRPLAALLIGAACSTMLTACSKAIVSTEQVTGSASASSLGHYFLPRAYVHFRVKGENGKVTITPQDNVYYPDGTAYRLDYHAAGTASDTLVLKVGGNGLLSEVDTTADDRFDELIEGLVSIPRRIAAGGAERFTLGTLETGDAGPRDVPEDFEIDLLFDPLTASREQAKKRLHEVARMTLAFEGAIGETAEKDPECGADGRLKGLCIYYRLPRSVVLTFRWSEAGVERAESFNAYVPDPSRIYALDFTRDTFVEKKTKAMLSNGMITQVDITKPSNVEALVNIPLSVARGIVSLPAQIFSIRLSNITGEKALIDGKTELAKSVAARDRQALADANAELTARKTLLSSQIDLGAEQLRLQQEIIRINEELARLSRED